MTLTEIIAYTDHHTGRARLCGFWAMWQRQSWPETWPTPYQMI
jgi:hypothetical protein